MADDFQNLTSEQLLELAAIEKLRNNDLQRYSAAAIDRISTSIAVAGLLGPVVIIASNDATKSFWVTHSLIIGYSLVLSCALHIIGRVILVRGLR